MVCWSRRKLMWSLVISFEVFGLNETFSHWRQQNDEVDFIDQLTKKNDCKKNWQEGSPLNLYCMTCVCVFFPFFFSVSLSFRSHRLKHVCVVQIFIFVFISYVYNIYRETERTSVFSNKTRYIVDVALAKKMQMCESIGWAVFFHVNCLTLCLLKEYGRFNCIIVDNNDGSWTYLLLYKWSFCLRFCLSLSLSLSPSLFLSLFHSMCVRFIFVWW